MAMSTEKPYPLILLQSAPYSGSLARSSLDLALSFAVFSQRPQLLFCGDAVLGLQSQQNAGAIGRKSLRKVIDSFPLYDIDTVFFEQSSLAQHGLCAESFPDFAVPASVSEVQKLIREASHVISL